MNRFICIHGHFYQPPRENPWLEDVELQDSAYPYHDWNSRITAECYGPNAASRLLDKDKKIIAIVSNYSKMSFNFGPTLLSWIEGHDQDVYHAILDADKKSLEDFEGHGAALAQAYNHMILPLAHSRDKRTQILWGIRDFERRFKRKPEGMWLAETAVDLETLDIMAEQNVLFTILAPRQAARVRRIGQEGWEDVSDERIDPGMPYLCRLPSGRSISLFFYNGSISKDVAFGGLLKSGENFAGRLISAFPEGDDTPRLVHIATDGETYGHHHRFGDMALAYCLHYLEAKELAHITVYGHYLAKHPPQYEVEVIENSSWSCVHGIERWRNDCGCCSGTHPGWHQKWRAPLRGVMDWLRDNLAQVYTDHLSLLIQNPWYARDEYIEVILDRSERSMDAFLLRHARRELTTEEKIKVLKLLEMQRCAMLMYTSCGWFFDEISGIENVQVLFYAARAMQLARETSGIVLEDAFIMLLEKAPSNIPDIINGAQVYIRFVQPSILDLMRVGAHFAVSSLFYEYAETTHLYVFTTLRHIYERLELGKQKLAIGKITVRSDITLEEELISFAVMHLGDHNLTGGVRAFISDDAFSEMKEQIKGDFQRGDAAAVITGIVACYGKNNYSLWHLFKDEQRAIFNMIFENSQRDIESSFARYMTTTILSCRRLIPSIFRFPLTSRLLSSMSSTWISRLSLKVRSQTPSVCSDLLKKRGV